VLVTHPGRQHSHQAALGLQAAGLLAGYWAGVPALAAQRGVAPERLWRRFIPYDPLPLPAALVRWQPAIPALRRIGDRLLPRRAAAWLDYAACRAFDLWVAERIDDAPLSPRTTGTARGAVIACEISARVTFEEARRRGHLAILDAPSIHHAAQDRLHGTADPPALHRRIVAVKEREIALADAILTVSELARATYVAAGVPPGKVHALPLGADLARFFPGKKEQERGEITFVFAGASIRRKGFDLLLRAFAEVARVAPGARLRVVGPRGELAHLLEGGERSERIVEVGPVAQEELARELRQADCLVLPSRNDSYGMVVAEALASGIPAIVSEMVGAKELITPGETGWIVPVEDVDALAQAMLGCARQPEAVRARSAACRRAAERATWPAYHARLAALIERLLEEGR
jgi:glycosyltransferase involved in cell wall biosynthesis